MEVPDVRRRFDGQHPGLSGQYAGPGRRHERPGRRYAEPPVPRTGGGPDGGRRPASMTQEPTVPDDVGDDAAYPAYRIADTAYRMSVTIGSSPDRNRFQTAPFSDNIQARCRVDTPPSPP
ncbi:hypothetical protein GCM10023324_55910 [Streptomyces youssoufiensis]